MGNGHYDGTVNVIVGLIDKQHFKAQWYFFCMHLKSNSVTKIMSQMHIIILCSQHKLCDLWVLTFILYIIIVRRFVRDLQDWRTLCIEPQLNRGFCVESQVQQNSTDPRCLLNHSQIQCLRCSDHRGTCLGETLQMSMRVYIHLWETEHLHPSVTPLI